METQNLYLSNSIVKDLPAMVKNELAKMPAQKQEEFLEEYKRKAKSLPVAYLFLIVVLAMHYGYTGRWGLQILFWVTFGGLWIWWLVDLFRLPGIVGDHNKDLAIEVMRNLKATSN